MKTRTLAPFIAAVCLMLASVHDAAGDEPPTLRVPDTSVLDQNGRALSFASDLVRGKTVAINFVYTTCKTTCPALTAVFQKVQMELGDRLDRDVRLISISVDPVTDTPARLRAYAEKFHARPGWSFVTGRKADIRALLNGLGVPAGNPDAHTPTILVGNAAAGHWRRAYGLAPASTIAEMITDAAARAPAASGPAGGAESPAARQAAGYFPDPVLSTQDGADVRFHDDVLRGKTVLINFMFTSCTDVCSPATANLARVQGQLGERLGRDIVMISVTVDPERDTPPVLRAYAARFGAKPGWHFLTGQTEDIDRILDRLGGGRGAAHSSLLIVGNVARGPWRKLMVMDDPAVIARVTLDLAR